MNTIFDAEISGSYAGLEPAQPREVPPEYRSHPKLAAVWLQAYDRTVTAQSNQRYGVMEAPPKAERRTSDREQVVPKKLKVATKSQVKPTMMAALDRQLAEQF